MKMSMGMNTNVKYQGRVYHIQTEDGGDKRPMITTLLFKDGGVVLSSKRTDYSDLLQSDSCRETVADMMKTQHKTMIKMLIRGEIPGIEPPVASPQKTAAADGTVIEATQADSLMQSGKEEDLDALILEYLAKKDGEVS